MQPLSETGWPESLRPLYETVTGTPVAEALAASTQWRESFAGWVRGATLEERTLAQAAAWSRMDAGERTPAELLFLLSSCSELLWPYAAPPQGLLPRLMWRQEVMLAALLEAGDAEAVARVRRETEATVTTVLTRILKRHPESLRALVGDAPCTFDGRALRFHGAVEVDLRQVLGTGARSVALLEQLRALMPATAAEGRDRLAEFIRTRAARLPWKEASEVLAERLFTLATSPDGRGGMSGFLACYPAGRKEPDWCARAGLLLSRTLEVGGPPEVVENLCELLARFDAPPVDGLRGALGALVGGSFESAADLRPVRFVLDHCQATLRKGEPGLVLTLLWLEERLFRAAVRQGAPDAFERRKRALSKLRPGAPGFEHLQWLAEECAELWPRFLPGGVRPGLDELAAWRHEVSERVGKKPMLRKAAIEFFLWCAPDAASSEAELTVLALVRTATDRRQVRKLKDHPSSRVRLRVRTLQSWLQGEGAKEKPGAQREPTPGAGPATLTEALRHLHVTRAVPLGGRTWLRDRDLEEALLGALSRVEAEFSSGYPARFREDADALAAGLLEGLASELERVKADLSALMSQGQAAPRELTLSVRRRMAAPVAAVLEPAVSESSAQAPGALAPAVSAPDIPEHSAVAVAPSVLHVAAPPPEMAEPAPGPVRTGVEVAFVVDVAVGDFLRTRRVVSLQVVKLEQRGEGQWLPAFKLGRELLDAQLLRTDSAFCLFLTPPFPRAECWVAPSRTVRALMESQRSLSGVTREAIQRVARPLSHWLLGDLVGLWTGDERPEAHARLADAAIGPDFIAEWRLG
ncbi:hypothetical protein [Comamonas sp. JC664]|uniref:hypothetical protein n=1 Tax=Comamonas sp. JC664 TaxID=2801917 RepID=UPI00174CAAFE|nr:hypothetical protein [Comamonas sp. JC664]MBL0696383.1 hypothetical protein [Comamonas sp. JC664]GHG83991.1 hypothetical protein GCM10012319_39050 [Comamonas sp. KCTC 72670]